MVRNLVKAQSASGNYQARPRFLFRNPQSAIRNRSQGLTLIEMLIGMAITLVMMAAVVNLFANIGSGIRVRRASMEMSSQLRMARARLFKDLAGATCAARPKLKTDDHNDGYIEIIDGFFSDSNPSELTNGDTSDIGEIDYATSLIPSAGDPQIVNPPTSTRVPQPNDVTNGGGLGDHDCILALTVRSDSEPFVGRWVNPLGNTETIESNLAEIIWYVVENPADASLGEPGFRTLYRRVLLIAPWVKLPMLNIYGGTTDENILAFYRNNDISAQIYTADSSGNLVPNTTTRLVPNTLADLTKRENRFAHRWNFDATALSWPYIMDQNVIRILPFDADNPPTGTSMVSPLRPFGRPFEPSGVIPERTGEDLVLSDVLAWDVRVFDPGAPLLEQNGVVLEPADSGWDPSTGNIVGFGAYVSLGWDQSLTYSPLPGAPTPLFQEPHTPGWHPNDPTNSLTNTYWAVYDTWPYQYENDGIDQDPNNSNSLLANLVDQGTNGLDDDNTNGTDDVGERETAPPYDVPLRGIQVKLRIYERDTRQIREATVTRGFVP